MTAAQFMCTITYFGAWVALETLLPPEVALFPALPHHRIHSFPQPGITPFAGTAALSPGLPTHLLHKQTLCCLCRRKKHKTIKTQPFAEDPFSNLAQNMTTKTVKVSSTNGGVVAVCERRCIL